MKYKNCNSFIQYFNIFHEKKKKKSENYIAMV